MDPKGLLKEINMILTHLHYEESSTNLLLLFYFSHKKDILMKQDKDIEPVEVFDGTAWQAGMVKSLLENSGIKAYLNDEIVGTMAPWWTAPGGAGSVTVFVSNQDCDQAKLIVGEYEKTQK
jgi:hypothetical protein